MKTFAFLCVLFLASVFILAAKAEEEERLEEQPWNENDEEQSDELVEDQNDEDYQEEDDEDEQKRSPHSTGLYRFKPGVVIPSSPRYRFGACLCRRRCGFTSDCKPIRRCRNRCWRRVCRKFIVPYDGFNTYYAEYIKNLYSHKDSDYDKDGYDKDGYDKDGYKKSGYNKAGYNRNGYDRSGYDKDGFDKYGFDKKGFDINGYNKYGFDKDGYNKNGYNSIGYDKYGCDINGFGKVSHSRSCRLRHIRLYGGLYSYKRYTDGFDSSGYDKDGYNRNGISKKGWDRKGYNALGYNKKGFDKSGYNRRGYDKDGYDKDGYDSYGIDRKGLFRKSIYVTKLVCLPVARSNCCWNDRGRCGVGCQNQCPSNCNPRYGGVYGGGRNHGGPFKGGSVYQPGYPGSPVKGGSYSRW